MAYKKKSRKQKRSYQSRKRKTKQKFTQKLDKWLSPSFTNFILMAFCVAGLIFLIFSLQYEILTSQIIKFILTMVFNLE